MGGLDLAFWPLVRLLLAFALILFCALCLGTVWALIDYSASHLGVGDDAWDEEG